MLYFSTYMFGLNGLDSKLSSSTLITLSKFRWDGLKKKKSKALEDYNKMKKYGGGRNKF